MPYLSLLPPRSRNQKTAKPRPKYELAMLFPVPSYTRFLCYAEVCVNTHTHLRLMHLTSTRAQGYQAGTLYSRLKTPIPAPAHSAEPHFYMLHAASLYLSLDSEIQTHSMERTTLHTDFKYCHLPNELHCQGPVSYSFSATELRT